MITMSALSASQLCQHVNVSFISGVSDAERHLVPDAILHLVAYAILRSTSARETDLMVCLRRVRERNCQILIATYYMSPMGIEPTTIRLRAWRSTNWARVTCVIRWRERRWNDVSLLLWYAFSDSLLQISENEREKPNGDCDSLHVYWREREREEMNEWRMRILSFSNMTLTCILKRARERRNGRSRTVSLIGLSRYALSLYGISWENVLNDFIEEWEREKVLKKRII